MKNLILLLLFNLCFLAVNANTSSKKECSPIHPDFISPYQSSTDGKFIAKFAIDKNSKTFSRTKKEDKGWFFMEFKNTTKLKEVAVKSPSLKDYYLFFSKAEFSTNEINELIKDPMIKYVHVKKGGDGKEGDEGDVIPLDDVLATYVLILPSKSEQIIIEDIRFCGTGPEGPLPCEICPEEDTVHPWFAEDCSNGKDDDGDGLIDCNDGSCGIGNVKTWVTDATCETCTDGKICFRARNATHFSIDGGVTWVPQTGWLWWKKACFYNLPAGIYDVRVKNFNTGCVGPPFNVVVNFPPPPPPPTLTCDNMNFENNFDGWIGHVGTNAGGSLVNLVEGINDEFHQIIPTGTFVDNNVPELNADHPWLMNNIARIGQQDNGKDGASLTYCFTVEPSSAAVTIAYAFVANNPDHGVDNDPFFSYRYYINGDPENTVLQGLKIDSMDPNLVQSENGEWVFTPFDCTVDDLAEFIGQEICIEITAAECALGAHEGYAYVDLECGDNRPLPIVEEPIVNQVGCDLLNFEGTGFGDFFNSYNWTISKIDANGNESNPISTDVIISQFPNIKNIIDVYLSNGGSPLECGDKIKLELTLYNTCAEDSNFVIFDYPCATENPVPEVTSLTQLEISCDGTEVDFEGQGTDFDSFSWTISRKTPAGNLANTFTTPLSYSSDIYLANAFAVFISNAGDVINCDDQLVVRLNLFNECEESFDDITIETPCISWKAAIPNIFSPVADNPVNQNFFMLFNATDYDNNQGEDCAVINNDITTITYYRLFIFDRWGNLLFDEETESSNADVQGDELKWDGSFNGQNVVSDVYVWMAWVTSCSINLDCTSDTNCGNFQYCSTGDTTEKENQDEEEIHVEIFSGDVTVIY